jgi:hypothetical protein
MIGKTETTTRHSVAERGGIPVIPLLLLTLALGLLAVEGASAQNSNSVNISFDVTCAVSAGAGASGQTTGSVSPSGKTACPTGSNLTFTARPHPNYMVDTWYLDNRAVQTNGTTYTLKNIRSKHSVSVTFAPTSFKVSAIAKGGGAVTPVGTVLCPAGSSLNFTARPSSNGVVKTWFVDGQPAQSHGTTFVLRNIRAAHNVVVSIVDNTFLVSASAGSGGTVSPTGDKVCPAGAIVTFIATPNVRTNTCTWSLDGKLVQKSGTVYTLKNVQANHTVTVSFSPNSTR